jgi:hypothetical protein
MKLFSEFRGLPHVEVNLRCAETEGNDPFFERMVREFHHDLTRRHPKFPLIRHCEYGITLCPMTRNFDDYFNAIESAARRNYRKSLRLGYSFERIECQNYIDDIAAILRSTPVRQGRQMPEKYFTDGISAPRNPASNSHLHDYPYFGIVRDGKLYAYASCLIAGDICSIETIYGHADHQADAIVPMLIIDMARAVVDQYPEVKYYSYGSYFGASETMQRFKRKFGFAPCRVRWIC